MQDFTNDYVPPRQAVEENPGLWPTLASFQWTARFRHDNGMADEGVIIERRADPNAKRARLLVSPSRAIAYYRKRSGACR